MTQAVQPTTSICHNCGADITLVPVGKHHKWVTNPAKARDSWRCGNDPDFPLKSHAPGGVRRDRDAVTQRLAETALHLRMALERTEANLLLAVNGKPVRDLSETLAENDAALGRVRS